MNQWVFTFAFLVSLATQAQLPSDIVLPTNIRPQTSAVSAVTNSSVAPTSNPVSSPSIGPSGLRCLKKNLINSKDTLIHQFNYSYECQMALLSQKNNLVCIGAELKNSDGNAIHQFDFQFSCLNTLANLKGSVFCANNLLKNTRGSTVFEFQYGFQCDEAAANIKANRFCADNTLMNIDGKVIATFDYGFECQETLEQAAVPASPVVPRSSTPATAPATPATP